LKNGKELRISFKGLPEDLDSDRILRIDYGNLEAEIATIPVLMNNVGMILAELDNDVRLSELQLSKTKAELAEQGREEIKVEKNGKAATNDETNEYVRNHVKYDLMSRKVSNIQMKRDVINSIYWSIKAKQEILQNISKSMNYSDFQDALVNTALKEINYVSLSTRDPLIK
jgi:hypothetical protein